MRTSSPCLRVPVAAEVSRRINKPALVWRRRSARVAPRPDTSCRDGAIKFMEIDSDTEYRQARARAFGRANKQQLKTEGGWRHKLARQHTPTVLSSQRCDVNALGTQCVRRGGRQRLPADTGGAEQRYNLLHPTRGPPPR